jgi:hypothetical protein
VIFARGSHLQQLELIVLRAFIWRGTQDALNKALQIIINRRDQLMFAEPTGRG